MDMGRNNAALIAFDQALKLDPSYDLALQNKQSAQQNSLGGSSTANGIINEGLQDGYYNGVSPQTSEAVRNAAQVGLTEDTVRF